MNNIKLSFTRPSETPVDLLVVILDSDKTLGEADDPAVRAHVEKALAAFKSKSLKREYVAMLGDGKTPSTVLVHWAPLLRSWNLWENVKTLTARSLRYARDYRLARVGILLNAVDAAPMVGKVVE